MLFVCSRAFARNRADFVANSTGETWHSIADLRPSTAIASVHRLCERYSPTAMTETISSGPSHNKKKLSNEITEWLNE